MMSDETVLQWLAIAKEAVLKAGDILCGRDKEYLEVDSERGRDIKLRADRASEKIIIDHLKDNSHFSILSEESGHLKRNESGLTWIVDPLDGSLNYSRGIPLCCVSVGLWKDDAPLLGAIYDFYRSELFAGIIGKGAWLNEEEIFVSAQKEQKNSVLCTGFPVSTDFSTESVMAFTKKIQQYKKVRLMGSAALSLAYVAVGRADTYIENDIKIWDVAAGIALVIAAGGAVDHLFSDDKHLIMSVTASNKH